jgi:hypothetical protein
VSAGRAKLTRKREQAIAALLSQPTHAEAAKSIGVAEATLQRWLRLPGFQAEYRLARRQVVEGAIGRLQAAACDAVEALRRNLTAGRPADQIRSALGIIDLAVRAIELTDTQERLDAIERRLAGRDGGGPAGPQGVVA